jgi:gamma-glutamyl:cysteine ligase YbdK (ATP-grasp superfamily)
MKEVSSLGLFAGYGIELEYMLVDAGSLSVLPVADQVLQAIAGETVDEVEVGELCWSNELVLHVIELKTNGPSASLSGLAPMFHEHLQRINALLEPLGGRLMPGAMHPWMDPFRESFLWPHDNSPIYETYNRIFGCRGHGWANLQSVHLNLPFNGDEEFARLHAAVRLLLPILPALAASSPVMDGKVTGLLDNRLEVYRLNQQRIPSVSGRVIPEPIFTRADYEAKILRAIYRDIAPHDPEGILQEEWLNSRGAIARFDRDTIEVRLLDVQECPAADLAIAALIVAVLKALTAESWGSLAEQQLWEIAPLEAILLAAIRDGDESLIDDRRYLTAFGFPGERAKAGELWCSLAQRLLSPKEEDFREPLAVILEQGPLARRLLRALGEAPSPGRIREVYGELCTCLAQGRLFGA